MDRRGILIVVSGFSGVGKSTLMKRIVGSDDNFALSVSVTTRQPRENEVQGVDYHFISRDEFDGMIEREELIEYAIYGDNYYGTPRTYVEEKLDEGYDVLLEIEIQGAGIVKKLFPDAVLVFITPPSVAELVSRLKNRGTETKEKIKKRLIRAKEESLGMDMYDYIIVNDDLDLSAARFIEVISAEHRRGERNKSLIRDIKADLDALDIKSI